MDLRKNAVTDKGLQMLCSALAIGKAQSLLEVKLSGGTLTGAVSARLMPVIKMRRPDLVFTIEVPEYVHATHARTLSVETQVEPQEPEQAETKKPPAQEQVKPTKVSIGRTASGANHGSSVVFDSDGGCACWLLPLGNAGNPPPPTGWLQKNLPPHLTVLQQESGIDTVSKGRSARQYRLSAQPGQNVPILVEEREAFNDGAAALLGDSAWAAALALAVWLALNPEKVQGRRVLELGAGVGLPALAAALAVSGEAAAKEVLMTDMYPELLQLMERYDTHLFFYHSFTHTNLRSACGEQESSPERTLERRALHRRAPGLERVQRRGRRAVRFGVGRRCRVPEGRPTCELGCSCAQLAEARQRGAAVHHAARLLPDRRGGRGPGQGGTVIPYARRMEGIL